MVLCNESGSLLYVGSPMLDGLDSLTSRSLFISDIPLHDATRDVILIGEQARAQVSFGRQSDFDRVVRIIYPELFESAMRSSVGRTMTSVGERFSRSEIYCPGKTATSPTFLVFTSPTCGPSAGRRLSDSQVPPASEHCYGYHDVGGLPTLTIAVRLSGTKNFSSSSSSSVGQIKKKNYKRLL